MTVSSPKVIVPSTQLYSDPPTTMVIGTGDGLLAGYYGDEALSSLVLTRVEGPVDFDWGSGSPDSGLPADGFSARWIGELEPQFTEDYAFYAATDDGVRLWIDGRLVIDEWRANTAEYSATVALTAAEKVGIRMEYFERTGSAKARLSWSSASATKRPIPAAQLYQTSGLAVTVPAESVTSPAFIEGTCWAPLPDDAEFSVTAAGGSSATNVPVVMLSDVSFALDLPLDATGAATPVSVTQSATGTVVTGSVTWLVTDLDGKSCSSDIIRIRKGDSLLVTAGEAGAGELAIDVDGDGTADLTGAAGSPVAVAYEAAGTYTTIARVGVEEAGSLTVVVVGADLTSPIACQVNFRREKDVTITPAECAAEVIFGSSTPAQLEASVKELTTSGATLYLKPRCRGTPVLTARLGGPTGPLLASREVDEFTLDVPGRCCVMVAMDVGTGPQR
jgi:hypothetical protein